MAYGINNPYIFAENELRSVRESVARLVKFQPFDVTLATAGTAENFINLSPNVPSVNLVTNPSMETGDPPTGFTAVSSAISRVAVGIVAPRTGSFSQQIITSNLVANEGSYFSLGPQPRGRYALSAYLRRAGGGTAFVRGWNSTNGFTNGNIVTMDGTWNNRSTVIHRVLVDQEELRLYMVTDVQQVLTYFVEDIQCEVSWGQITGTSPVGQDSLGYVSDFIDPRSDRWSRWDGTADASRSIREPNITEIWYISAIAETSDLYWDKDRDASSVAGLTNNLLRAGDTLNLPLIAKSRLSFVNAVAGQRPRIRGFVMGV